MTSMDVMTDLYWQIEGRQYLPPDWDEKAFLEENKAPEDWGGAREIGAAAA